MNISDFQNLFSLNEPPAHLSVHLQALWWDGKGNWEAAHETIQDMPGANAAWIHAYLHRKEGDLWNADYWYQKAGKVRPGISLEEEWENMVMAL